jgi:CRP-like cAMP-binding protein
LGRDCVISCVYSFQHLYREVPPASAMGCGRLGDKRALARNREELVRISFRNILLAKLSSADLALIEFHLTPVTLAVRDALEEPNEPVASIFFPETGIVSVVAADHEDRKIEAGVIGREGMTGVAVVLGDDRSANETYVQVAATGHRIATAVLRDAMDSSNSMRDLFLRYAQVFLTQVVQTALANGRAKIDERLARWLLMAHDRLDGLELPLTHDFLALMLGVRRPGVTEALHLLEGKRLIGTNRGRILVLDRDGLEKLAGGSYGIPEAEFRRLMGAPAGLAGREFGQAG